MYSLEYVIFLHTGDKKQLEMQSVMPSNGKLLPKSNVK